MGLLTASAIAFAIIVSAVVILGILYLTIQIDKKITAGRIKKYIKNEQRLEGAAKAVIHSKEGKSVKANILKEGDNAPFAELTVTGKSTSFMLRNNRVLKVK